MTGFFEVWRVNTDIRCNTKSSFKPPWLWMETGTDTFLCCRQTPQNISVCPHVISAWNRGGKEKKKPLWPWEKKKDRWGKASMSSHQRSFLIDGRHLGYTSSQGHAYLPHMRQPKSPNAQMLLGIRDKECFEWILIRFPLTKKKIKKGSLYEVMWHDWPVVEASTLSHNDYQLLINLWHDLNLNLCKAKDLWVREGQAIVVHAAGLTLFLAVLITIFACFPQSGSAYLIPSLMHYLWQTHTLTDYRSG